MRPTKHKKRNREYVALITSERWRLLRTKYIRSHPLCEDCQTAGLLTFATEVHHVRPIEQGRTPSEMVRLAFDPTNLRALCHSCHVEAHRALNSHSRKAMQENNARVVERFAERFL